MASVSAHSASNEEPVTDVTESLDKLEVTKGTQHKEVGLIFLTSQQL